MVQGGTRLWDHDPRVRGRGHYGSGAKYRELREGTSPIGWYVQASRLDMKAWLTRLTSKGGEIGREGESEREFLPSTRGRQTKGRGPSGAAVSVGPRVHLVPTPTRGTAGGMDGWDGEIGKKRDGKQDDDPRPAAARSTHPAGVSAAADAGGCGGRERDDEDGHWHARWTGRRGRRVRACGQAGRRAGRRAGGQAGRQIGPPEPEEARRGSTTGRRTRHHDEGDDRRRAATCRYREANPDG